MKEFKDVELGHIFEYEGKNYIRCITFGRLEDGKNGIVKVFNCIEIGTGITFYLPDTEKVATEFDILPEKRKDLKFSRDKNPEEWRKEKDDLIEFFETMCKIYS